MANHTKFEKGLDPSFFLITRIFKIVYFMTHDTVCDFPVVGLSKVRIDLYIFYNNFF